ncbi:MAG: hypothetical protein KAI03_07500, partial [Candidatus Aureabacteria bacterium]|nr:hypothetical protein [Candidatus Auribacterota bacterium]
LKVEQEPGKWNIYYVTPEGYGQWCFDQPVDEVGNWHIYADEFGEEGNKYSLCRVSIEGQRTDTAGKKDRIFLALVSFGGADLIKIKEGGKWRVYHVNAQGEKHHTTGFVKEIFDWKIAANGACFVEVGELKGKRRLYDVTAQGKIRGMSFEEKKEVFLANGRVALLLKVRQSNDKWNFYYISPEGNGRWCLDKPLDNVEDWYISAREAGEKGDKYQICSVTIEGERKDKTGNMDEVSLELISAGGVSLAKIKESGKWRVYHVTAQGQRNDITGEVDSLPGREIGANGAAFVEVREGEKHRVYHVTARGKAIDVTGLVDKISDRKISKSGAGFVIVKDDKIKVYFVSSYGEKETVAENVDEILWAGFNAAEDCFTVYYRVGKNYHRRKISVYSQGEDGLTVKSLAELKPRMVRASHISHVTQNILTELSKQALAAYKNKKAGGVTGQEWTGILNLGQLVILGSDIRGLDVASDGNMYIPTGKKGTVGVISSNGDFFDLAIGDQSKSAQITKKSCSTDKYVVSNTDKGIGIQSGVDFKQWIPAVFEDIIVRETPEGCEIFGLNVGRISRILYYETTN